LAASCADLLIGGDGPKKNSDAWRQIYRGLEHGVAAKACASKVAMAKFGKVIQDFASAFVELQNKRLLADYDPYETHYKAVVLDDIALAEAVIAAFTKAPIAERRAFAALVLIRPRR